MIRVHRIPAGIALAALVSTCAGARAPGATNGIASQSSSTSVVSAASRDAAAIDRDGAVGNSASSTTGIVAMPIPRPNVPAAPDAHLPSLARSSLPNGLEVNVLEYHALPLLQIRLTIRGAGSASDPADRPGLATFVGDMLREGTATRTSAQFANEIDFLGGRLSVVTDQDSTTVHLAVLSEFADTALALVADMVLRPTFVQTEIDKLRRRELDRLTRDRNDPIWLSRQAFVRAVYGSHPYGHADTTPRALAAFTRDAIVAYHRQHFVAGAMHLVVVGDTHAPDVRALAARHFASARRGRMPAPSFASPSTPTVRRVVVVDRPGSAQSVVRIGNLSLRRTADDFVAFAVANQVLGGGPSSRLFMDLRERRSLTYGAYSRTTETVDVGTFQASGSVRTPVTVEAVRAFLEHLERIDRETAPANELDEARRFLTDSFALTIATPDDLCRVVSEMRTFGLADTYWDTYRTRVRGIDAAGAFAAAQRYIHADRATVVVVGDAARFQDDLRAIGPVRIESTDGTLVRELPAR